MTIAAGFKCLDSVILCTDHEITYKTLKLPGRKIFPLNVPKRQTNIAFAIAGSVSFARSAFQFLKRGLLTLGSGAFDETSLQVFLEDQLCKFYKKHIFNHPRYGYADGPQVSFVIAAQFNDSKSLCLFSTEETTVNPEHPYCFAGNGEELAKYIVDPLVLPQMDKRPLREALLLATHMIRQVQKSAGNCGQGSSFFRLSNDGDFHPVHDFPLPNVEAYSKTFEGIVRDLFYASANLELDDAMVLSALKFTEKTIKKIRREQRAEKDRLDKLNRMLFGKRN